MRFCDAGAGQNQGRGKCRDDHYAGSILEEDEKVRLTTHRKLLAQRQSSERERLAKALGLFVEEGDPDGRLNCVVKGVTLPRSIIVRGVTFPVAWIRRDRRYEDVGLPSIMGSIGGVVFMESRLESSPELRAFRGLAGIRIGQSRTYMEFDSEAKAIKYAIRKGLELIAATGIRAAR